MYSKKISKSVLKWYSLNKRDLPWRYKNNSIKDPYKIWLSEIILQQTRIVTGSPYYERFIEKYPNVMLLASSSEDEVLKMWEGLGYYSRARNLHKTAKIIVEEFESIFPSNYETLIKLSWIFKLWANHSFLVTPLIKFLIFVVGLIVFIEFIDTSYFYYMDPLSSFSLRNL